MLQLYQSDSDNEDSVQSDSSVVDHKKEADKSLEIKLVNLIKNGKDILPVLYELKHHFNKYGHTSDDKAVMKGNIIAITKKSRKSIHTEYLNNFFS